MNNKKFNENDVKRGYDHWASSYDTVPNLTRDLEATALSSSIQHLNVGTCLEIGCGTGKNTSILLNKAVEITAADFSKEMIKIAQKKIPHKNVTFCVADITKEWVFTNNLFDFISFSLVLEHVENLNHVFEQAASKLKKGGHIYIGELHPIKQSLGSRARFTNGESEVILPSFLHHLSDFITAAEANKLQLFSLKEYFDIDNKIVPRILTLIFIKK